MNSGSPNRPLRLLKGAEQQATDRDAALVEEVRSGNPQAAVAFHDRIIGVVNRTVSRLLGTRDSDYDDVVQQALIELVLAADRFRGDCPLDAWVSIISARAVYRHLRRRKVERRLFVLEGAEGADHAARTNSNTAMLRVLIRRIEAHVHAIEPKKAWTFILHDVHGYNLAEIAEITGASQTAVQSRLVRARKELHARIAATGDLAMQLCDYSSLGGAE